MSDTSPPLLSSAEIARLAGVTRAAVTNWRKRYPDFPKPVGSATSSAKFSLEQVTAWLESQKRGAPVSDEIQLWEALRARHGDDMLGVITAIAQQLAESGIVAHVVDEDTAALIRRMVDASSPTEVVENLAARLVGSTAHAGIEQYSTPQLAEAVACFADRVHGSVLDPACGLGTLLLAIDADSDARFFVQDYLNTARLLTVARLRLQEHSVDCVKSAAGDSLREDEWPELKADLVVCEVPTGEYDWGREELLLDWRWEFGLPPRAEGELAWLQHCFAHTAEGGRALVVMPASVAYRKAGRRIRAEMIRRGALVEVVALPGGIAAAHAQPVHLWILGRPESPQNAATLVRMTDLTANQVDGPYLPAPEQTIEVPAIELLTEDVDLTPSAYVAPARTDYVGQYSELREAVEQHLRQLVELLPALEAGTGGAEWTTVSVTDLSRAGLVEATEHGIVSNTYQLDGDFLNGFLRGAANSRRSVSNSGVRRSEIRGTRIPQMGGAAQQEYGAAFRALNEFETRLSELAELGKQAVELGRDGLTGGALDPARPAE